MTLKIGLGKASNISNQSEKNNLKRDFIEKMVKTFASTGLLPVEWQHSGSNSQKVLPVWKLSKVNGCSTETSYYQSQIRPLQLCL